MKVGLISDIHSNFPALEKVLSYLEDAGVDRIIHAGDVIGYNPFPNEVIQLMNKYQVESIKGNHEIIFLTQDFSRSNHPAAVALRWTKDVLSADLPEYICSLPDMLKFEVEGVSIAVFHGSPSSAWTYIYEQMAGKELLKETGADILVLGHTHIPYVNHLKPGLIVNPGSVGQPRDRNIKASLAILEPRKMVAEIKRLAYNVDIVRSKIDEVGLPPELGNRLEVGR